MTKMPPTADFRLSSRMIAASVSIRLLRVLGHEAEHTELRAWRPGGILPRRVPSVFFQVPWRVQVEAATTRGTGFGPAQSAWSMRRRQPNHLPMAPRRPRTRGWPASHHPSFRPVLGDTARPRNTITAWLSRTTSSTSSRPICSPILDLGTVVILSTIRRDGD